MLWRHYFGVSNTVHYRRLQFAWAAAEVVKKPTKYTDDLVNADSKMFSRNTLHTQENTSSD